MSVKILSALGLASCALFTAPANAASLIGDNVTCNAVGYTCSGLSSLVGPGTEFVLRNDSTNSLSFDFTSEGLVVTATEGVVFNFSAAVTFANLTNSFFSVALAGDVPPAFFRATIDPRGALNVELSRVFFESGRRVTLALTTTPVAAVPEASTWAMMLVGFGLIGATARYRRRRATKVAYA